MPNRHTTNYVMSYKIYDIYLKLYLYNMLIKSFSIQFNISKREVCVF